MNYTPIDKQNDLMSKYIVSQPNYITRQENYSVMPIESRVKNFEEQKVPKPLNVREDYQHPIYQIGDARNTEERTPISLYKIPETSSIDRSGINTRQYLQK